MTGAKKLVVGASGFLGSYVTRQLVDRGDDVRVLIRRTSSTKAIGEPRNEGCPWWRCAFPTRTVRETGSRRRTGSSWPTLDHGKAERELGWQPKPIHDSIARAALFYREHLRSTRSAAD